MSIDEMPDNFSKIDCNNNNNNIMNYDDNTYVNYVYIIGAYLLPNSSYINNICGKERSFVKIEFTETTRKGNIKEVLVS